MLSAQEVLTRLYGNLQYEMGRDFLVIQQLPISQQLRNAYLSTVPCALHSCVDTANYTIPHHLLLYYISFNQSWLVGALFCRSARPMGYITMFYVLNVTRGE